MSNGQIDPHKVTKPIQLLGAWLLGLTVINGSFLGAAVAISAGQWERSALIVAAIANVPIFLIALFVLQTRFRAELQEDSFYFQYISKKTEAVVKLESLSTTEVFPKTVIGQQPRSKVTEQTSESLDWSRWVIALNDHREDFLEIRKALQAAGIPVSLIFGLTNQTKPPKQWVISINSGMRFEYVVALLKVLINFSFDGFNRWEPVQEAGETEDVYIGSYGDRSYVRFSAQLKAILDAEADEIVFQHYCLKNVSEF
ncbi:hypothetical protein [Bradyrhizobium yuanmingense]|uniref:hypothetical protein n=1 Tax=Bradyrhizobium yuanmingense TaxID=108015 RepID=UPI0035166A19